MNLRCNMMHISAFYSYWQKFIQILMVKCLRLINQSQHFAMIVVKLQIMMVYGLTGLYIQRIRVMFRQYVEGHNSFRYAGGTSKNIFNLSIDEEISPGEIERHCCYLSRRRTISLWILLYIRCQDRQYLVFDQ